MFRKEDIVIEFLEETRELTIPIEILEDKNQTLQIIEENLEVKIPKKYQKKRKLEKYLENIDLEYSKFKKKKKSLRAIRNLAFGCLFSLPILILLWFITENTSLPSLQKLNFYITLTIYLTGVSSVILTMILGIPKIREKSWKVKQSTMLVTGILILYTFGVFSLIDLLYGGDKKYKDFIIKEAMNTVNHQFIASIFYNSEDIQKTLSRVNVEISSKELYSFERINFQSNFYANAYEKEILSKDHQDQIYKIIKIEGTLGDGVNKYSGYLTVVYDPANVKIATSVGAGTTADSYGQKLSQISKENDALIAMNAGGFYDPDWASNGGIPHGTVIAGGKIKTDYNRGIDSGGMIGFTRDNQLVLKRMSAVEAVNMGIRDAVDWGPFLIVNGNNYFKKETSRWACARSAIGQRRDGIVLMLVIDGDQPHSKGASYSDLANIMEQYGAYNAANLDGGTSTAMTENHEYINTPFNGQRRTIRSLPNAWIVTGEK